MLFEVMLAVALFVGAGAFCLSVTRSLFGALDRVQREQLALDLARSKLAEVEAGLISVTDLRGTWSGAVGSHEPAAELDSARAARTWAIDATTTRSEHPGLSLLELTVTEETEDLGAAGVVNPISVTIRQLVALRELEPEAYEQDELLEGLPEAEP
jgi:hypothetical protein